VTLPIKISGETTKAHLARYDVHLGDKLIFQIVGTQGRYMVYDLRGHCHGARITHTVHAALSHILDELVPEGVPG
jgi:hypothetical protein